MLGQDGCMASISTSKQIALDFDAEVLAPEVSPTAPQITTDARAVQPVQAAASEAQGQGGAVGSAASLLRTGTDWVAIESWVSAKADDADRDRDGRPGHTARAYRREARRFLLWLQSERGATLGTASLVDCLAYRAFLANPAPVDRWCAPRGPQIGAPEWRPFEGLLCATARRQAITILAGLYRFLQDQKFVVGNPWSGVSMPRNSDPRVDPTRRLTHAQWAAIERHLARPPADDRARQLRWAVHFLYETGLRLAEVTAANCGDFEWVDVDDLAPTGRGVGEDAPSAGAWIINVLGKGLKPRQVPVAPHLIDELGELLCASGGSCDPRDHADRPLLIAVAQGQPAGQGLERRIYGQTLYRQLKRLFTVVATDLSAQGRRRDAEKLQRASTHWLRHTYGSHAIAAGTAIDVVQRNLGHASMTSTGVYVDPELSRRVRESARLSNQAMRLRETGPPT